MRSSLSLSYGEKMLVHVLRSKKALEYGLWLSRKGVFPQFPLSFVIDHTLLQFLFSVLVVNLPFLV